MTGYFISFFISHAVNFLLSLNLLVRTSKIRLSFSAVALTLTAALTAGFGAAFVRSPMFRVISFLGLFGSLLTLFGVVSMEDLRWLRGLVTKK